jgi:replicative DNA helicase
MATKLAAGIIPVDRVPPHNIDAERSVLGAMLLDADAIARVVEVLDEDAFYNGAHRQIYRAILTLFDRNEGVDILTTVEMLRKQGGIESVGGASYLAELLDAVPTSANVEYYARIIREKAILRSLIGACTHVITEAYEETGEPDDLLDNAEQRIFDIAENKLSAPVVPVKDLLVQSMERLENIARERSGVTGIPTGFKELDNMLSGLQNSELIIVAGRTAMGKTSFALNIAEHVGIKKQLHVAIFSLEMSKEQVVQRLLCSEGRVNWHNLRTGYLAQEEFAKLPMAADRLSRASIYIDDTPSVSILEIKAKARRLKAAGKLDLVIVDYIQLVQGRGRTETRQQEVAEISRSLKAMARELSVPVIGLSQLSREADKREGGLPRLSDLRESGSIEQDADVVLMLYRHWEYTRRDEKDEDKRKASVSVAKQRNGPTGTVDLIFEMEYSRFENAETVREEF